jgi:hypothetical protein
MPREEPRELIFVATQREYSMPKVYAKTATWVLTTRRRDIVARTWTRSLTPVLPCEHYLTSPSLFHLEHN